MTDHNDKLDQATQGRLAKLASMPVDLSRLEQKMADQLPARQQHTTPVHINPMQGWLRVAAIIALMISVAGASYYAFFGVGPQAAIAQTMTVAELHEHLLNDPQEDYLAKTVEEAQALIDAQLAGKHPLPIVDGTHVESCCLVEGEFPLRAALVVTQPSGNFTIIIAQGEDFAQSMHPIDHPSGVQLQGHDHAGMPMVMRNVGDQWMCVMGDVNQQTLASVAAGLNF